MGKWCLHASLFILIKSSSKLLVTRTGIKARSSSILAWIRPLILELLAFEWLKLHTFELEYLWSQLVSLDQILYAASLGCVKGCISFWGRLTWHTGLRWAIVALWATCSHILLELVIKKLPPLKKIAISLLLPVYSNKCPLSNKRPLHFLLAEKLAKFLVKPVGLYL